MAMGQFVQFLLSIISITKSHCIPPLDAFINGGRIYLDIYGIRKVI